MPKVKIENGSKLVAEHETLTQNMVIVTPDKDGMQTIFTTDRMKLDADWTMDQTYLDYIRALKKKYPEQLGHIVPERIMVLIDDKFEKTDKTTKKSAWHIRLYRISNLGKMMGTLFNFDYVIKLRAYWLKQWSDAQVVAALLSQLLRIEEGSGVLVDAADETYLSKVAITFGVNYLDPNVFIPNVLEETVQLEEFKKAPAAAQQTSMFDGEDESLPFDPGEEEDEV